MEAQNDHILKDFFFFPGPKRSASLGSPSPTNAAIFCKVVFAGISSLYSRQRASDFLLSVDLKHNTNLEF